MADVDRPPRVLVVDDVPQNVRLLEAVLAPRGYDVLSATDGDTALELVATEQPDLILLDVLMPGLDGYEVCSRLRANEETAVLPVIMVTSSVGEEKTKAIEAGADDFIPKPFNQDELLTRVRSLLRIKRYHDTIKAQAQELAELNRTLEDRVQAQVDELERLRLLRRFLSPQLADVVVSTGNEAILTSHRRQVAMFFADLRGWTSFVDAVEPEELMRVLGEFHEVIGSLVKRFDATVGFLEGDGVQLFFNDPFEVPDAPLRAVRLGCALRERMAELTPIWQKRGHDLDFGAGIALGYATCGEIGFEGRSDYAPIAA
jgi:CheY-like chemotaxis protein/class 3 adenylate cyclase